MATDWQALATQGNTKTNNNPQGGLSQSDASNPTIIKSNGLLPKIINYFNPTSDSGLSAQGADLIGQMGPGMAPAAIEGTLSALPKIGSSIASNASNLRGIVTGHNLWENMVDAAKSSIDWGKVSGRALSNAKNDIQPVKDLISQILKQEGPKPIDPTIPPEEPFISKTLPDMSSSYSRGGQPNTILKRDFRFSKTNPAKFKDVTLPNIESGTDTSLPDSVLREQSAPVESSPNLVGGKDALEKRAAIGKSIPTNFWTGQSNLDKVESRAYAHVREALSSELKLANPALENIDKLYGLHQDIRQIAPKVLGALGIGGAGLGIVNFLGNALRGNSSGSDSSAP